MTQSVLAASNTENLLREVAECARPKMLPKYYGARMVLVEMSIYSFMENICPDYCGGYWHFYEIPGGFYMAPGKEEPMKINVSGNYFDDDMSSDAAGIVACLFIYSHMSFKYPEGDFSDLYHSLRDLAAAHPEAAKIYRAID